MENYFFNNDENAQDLLESLKWLKNKPTLA